VTPFCQIFFYKISANFEKNLFPSDEKPCKRGILSKKISGHKMPLQTAEIHKNRADLLLSLPFSVIMRII